MPFIHPFIGDEIRKPPSPLLEKFIEGGWLQYMIYTDFGSGPFAVKLRKQKRREKNKKTFKTIKKREARCLWHSMGVRRERAPPSTKSLKRGRRAPDWRRYELSGSGHAGSTGLRVKRITLPEFHYRGKEAMRRTRQTSRYALSLSFFFYDHRENGGGVFFIVPSRHFCLPFSSERRLRCRCSFDVTILCRLQTLSTS